MIGIFDSGFGGLTIFKNIIKKLPNYDYIYLGDSARAPYGSKSQEVIYEYTRQAVDFLFKQGCKLIIIACNTASAKALKKIQQEWLPKNYPTRRVLGVIIPIAEAVAEMVKIVPKKNRVGIIGTRATIESGAYEREIKKLYPTLIIFNQACPLLVSLVEEDWGKRRETRMILKYYLRPLKNKKINVLVLGCTHYPILLKSIQAIMGKQCQVLDLSQFVACKLVDYLNRHPEIEAKISKKGKRIFYTTDDIKRFKQLGEKFLGEKIKKVEKIELK